MSYRRQAICVEILNLKVMCKQFFACPVYIKNWLLKALLVTYCYIFDRTNNFELSERFLQKLESSLEV